MRFSKPNKIFIFFSVLFIAVTISSTPAIARPPSAIIMKYDLNTTVLDVEIKHVTVNVVKHYIRKVIIYKNDQEIFNKTYPRQPQPQGFEEQITVAAKVGDILHVKAFCSEAGIGEEKLEVVAPEKK